MLRLLWFLGHSDGWHHLIQLHLRLLFILVMFVVLQQVQVQAQVIVQVVQLQFHLIYAIQLTLLTRLKRFQ